MSAIPLALAAGLAIDTAKVSKSRSELQAAIDEATLAAAAAGDKFDEAQAKSFFMANLNVKDIDVTGLQFTRKSNGNVTGRVVATVATNLLRLASINSAQLALTAETTVPAVTKLDTVTFDITNAQGAYDKDIYFFTKDNKGKLIKETLVLQYDYDNSKGAGKKTFTPAKTKSVTVSVGSYETYGERMVVYEDLSYTGKHVSPKSYSSDDADASTRIQTKGECSSTQKQNWEDGGDSNYLDFVFNLSCTTKEQASGNVALVK